jgi:4-hydroxybenzoate polyprenyltransferase
LTSNLEQFTGTQTAANTVNLPLCVDLDGTLVKTDTLHESLLAMLRSNPLALFLLPFWLLRGKAHFKRQIALRGSLDPACLPYHQDFLAFLRASHEAGRELVLATAADAHIAHRIADHLGIFSRVLASTTGHNLKGERKGQRLREEFGLRGFDYAGNSKSDHAIWRSANKAILVQTSEFVRRGVHTYAEVERDFPAAPLTFQTVRKALRLHQWVKNILVFVPLVLSHHVFVGEELWAAIMSFFAFSLLASSVYVTNDLIDLPSDRQHISKRRRPFAAGDLPLSRGMILAPLLLAWAFEIAAFLPPLCAALLAVYLMLTFAYSLYLKRKMLVDVIVLAGLYTLRILVGGAAANIPLSPWLLGLSIFLFFSLALVKRVSELRQTQAAATSSGRGYFANDLGQLSMMGIASGYVACLVLALYMNSPEVTSLYRNPRWLWLICPLALYFVSRIWMLAQRGKITEDPVVFALRDRISYAVGLCAGVLILLAV